MISVGPGTASSESFSSNVEYADPGVCREDDGAIGLGREEELAGLAPAKVRLSTLCSSRSKYSIMRPVCSSRLDVSKCTIDSRARLRTHLVGDSCACSL